MVFGLHTEGHQKVLDLGTGTGIWAIDFADQYPSAVVTGTDLSPIQPTWVPPNIKFEIEDFNDEWTFELDEFDYIHLRSLYGCVPDWPEFYRKAYR
jgi:methylase of polypeptide subunit release factors